MVMAGKGSRGVGLDEERKGDSSQARYFARLASAVTKIVQFPSSPSMNEVVLGNARTAALESGGMIDVRAPMREDEEPVVRPYVLVDDIEAAVEAAEAAGGEIAMPPTEIPGHGKFAIYIQGGIQHGLWQF